MARTKQTVRRAAQMANLINQGPARGYRQEEESDEEESKSGSSQVFPDEVNRPPVQVANLFWQGLARATGREPRVAQQLQSRTQAEEIKQTAELERILEHEMGLSESEQRNRGRMGAVDPTIDAMWNGPGDSEPQDEARPPPPVCPEGKVAIWTPGSWRKAKSQDPPPSNTSPRSDEFRMPAKKRKASTHGPQTSNRAHPPPPVVPLAPLPSIQYEPLSSFGQPQRPRAITGSTAYDQNRVLHIPQNEGNYLLAEPGGAPFVPPTDDISGDLPPVPAASSGRPKRIETARDLREHLKYIFREPVNSPSSSSAEGSPAVPSSQTQSRVDPDTPSTSSTPISIGGLEHAYKSPEELESYVPRRPAVPYDPHGKSPMSPSPNPQSRQLQPSPFSGGTESPIGFSDSPGAPWPVDTPSPSSSTEPTPDKKTPSASDIPETPSVPAVPPVPAAIPDTASVSAPLVSADIPETHSVSAVPVVPADNPETPSVSLLPDQPLSLSVHVHTPRSVSSDDTPSPLSLPLSSPPSPFVAATPPTPPASSAHRKPVPPSTIPRSQSMSQQRPHVPVRRGSSPAAPSPSSSVSSSIFPDTPSPVGKRTPPVQRLWGSSYGTPSSSPSTSIVSATPSPASTSTPPLYRTPPLHPYTPSPAGASRPLGPLARLLGPNYDTPTRLTPFRPQSSAEKQDAIKKREAELAKQQKDEEALRNLLESQVESTKRAMDRVAQAKNAPVKAPRRHR